MSWFRVDLHLHTPASTDYQEPSVSPLDILRQAETRGLDIMAFTDHNSVRGYADMWREIEDLELLEYLGRLQPKESERLAEYRRILDHILLVPGFELTATFGFHILAIFPEGTSVRMMEHLLLTLGVPECRFGSGEVGATTDVLRAYEILDDHGALVIGAHVNSANGVAMQGLRFGGQTKIAYTQDRHLHALEVTDLAAPPNRRSTARFFSGAKSEYPRRMHCIQGSDAHRLERDPNRANNFGVGERVTEVLLPEPSFAALRELFLGDDFTRTRPFVDPNDPFELFRVARSDGNTATQAFHENMATKRSGMSHVLRDLVAFANTSGGTVYIGASPSDRRPIAGVGDSRTAVEEISSAIQEGVQPEPPVTLELIKAGDKNVVALRVATGPERPYAAGPGGFFVRDGEESRLAVRDEIVAMVRGLPFPVSTPPSPTPTTAPVAPNRFEFNGLEGAVTPEPPTSPLEATGSNVNDVTRRTDQPATSRKINGVSGAGAEEIVEDGPLDDIAPRVGVEIVSWREDNDAVVYTMRDLRNGALYHNVARDTQRRLWRYAIKEHENRPVDASQVRWSGDHGYLRGYRPRGEKPRHNLVYRTPDGTLRVFYGVGTEGLEDAWRSVLPGAKLTS